MNKIVSIVLAIVAIIAGALAFQQRNEISLIQGKLTAAINARDTAESNLRKIQDELDLLKERNTFLASERDKLREKQGESSETAPAVPTVAENTPPSGKPAVSAEGITKMMQSPEMKKMMRTQMERHARKSFGDLLTKWNLPNEDSDLVMNLLTERAAVFTESGLNMFKDGKMDEEAMKKAGEEMSAKRDGYDAQLKSLLGEERYKELEEHERTSVDRSMISRYKDEFEEAGMPLKEEQTATLVKMMREERSKARSPIVKMEEKDATASLNKMYSEEGLQEWKKDEEAYQQRVLSRAAETLNPDQVITLRNALKQESEMMEMSLKMGREMFNPTPTKK